MTNKLRIGITYDVKEDYNFKNSDWKHSDFCTLAEVGYIKELFENLGHKVYLLGNFEKLNQYLKTNTLPSVDVIFNTAEGIGSRNREGWVPALLELNKIPYSGSDSYGLSLTLNKIHTKIIARHLGIPTPDFYEINSRRAAKEAAIKVKGPWVLKPNYEGSSSGVVFVETFDELESQAVSLLDKYSQTILCETYIDGKEYNVAMLHDGEESEVIETVEIVRKNGDPLHIFGVYDKFNSTCTKIPSQLSSRQLNDLNNAALSLHRYIGCLDYNRADFRIDEKGNFYFLELNPLPNIDQESGFAMCCTYAERPLDRVLEQIVLGALKRFHSQPFQR